MFSDRNRIELEISNRPLENPQYLKIKQHIFKFVERYKPPKLIQGKTDNLNSPILITEIEFPLYNLLTRKNPGPDGFVANFYQIFMEKYKSNIIQTFPENKRVGNTSNSFDKASTKLILKSAKSYKKFQATILYEHSRKKPYQALKRKEM